MSLSWKNLLVGGTKQCAKSRLARRSRVPLWVEELGERICPSILIPVTNHRDLVFDPARNQLDITTSAGTVQRFDIASQTLLTPLTVGTSLNGADITADGSALYVTENQTIPNPAQINGIIHKVDLTSGAVTNLPYNLAFAEGGSFGLALGSGGKGLFDGRFNGSGWVPLRQVDLATDTLSIRTDDPGSGNGGQVRQNTMIRRSADRSLLFFTESNISSGPIFTYNATTNTFSKGFSTNAFLDNASSAVNRNGTRLALAQNGSIRILDANFNTSIWLPYVTGGETFDPQRDILYAVNPNLGVIDAYNTNTWAIEYQLPIDESVTDAQAFGNGVMTVSSDGSLLFLATPSGVREFNLPASTATSMSFTVPESSVAGSPFNVTVTAKDTYGNVAIGYRGTVHFTSSDPQAVLPSDYTFTAADAGVHTFPGVTLYTVSTQYPFRQSVTATDTATSSLTWTAYDRVTAAAASSYQVSAPAAVAAGSPFSVKVMARDQYGNVATGYNGTTHFTSSDPTATLPPDYTFVFNDQGVHTFTSGVTLTTLGDQTVTATDTANGALTATATSTVNPEVAGLHFTVAPSTSSATAGTAFSVTITALDGDGNIATGYTGTVTFATSDTGAFAALPAPYTFTAADAGVHTFNGVRLVTAGSQTITAFDRGIIDGSSVGSAGVQVNPNIATSFNVTGFPSPITAGVSATFTVTARDSFGNLATGYTGTVFFRSTDVQASLPANYAFTATDAGVHVFTATLKTVPSQSQSIYVNDFANPNIAGLQTGIVVTPATAARLAYTLQGPIMAGTTVTFLLTALDAFGNEATGYRGTVHFTSSDPQATLPADYTYTTSDNGQHAFSSTILRTAGTQTITATDIATSSITGTTTQTIVPGPVSLVYAFASTSPLSTTAGQAFTLSAKALDAFGNIVTNFTGTVTWSSSDGQATLPAAYTFTTADQGVHTFTNAFTLRKAGVQTVTASWQQGTSSSTSTVSDTVIPAAASRLQLRAAASATAGSPFNLTVTAFDPFSNVATSFTGTVHFTSTDPTATLPADYSFTAADAGTHTFTNGAALDTAGTQTITVTSGSLTSFAQVKINPAAATHFRFSAPASSSAGSAFSATVTALDPFNNVATGYTGTIHFTSSDGLAVLPGNYTFTAADAGAHTFTNGFTLGTAGSQTLTATDTGNATITGTATVTVNPAAAVGFRFAAPASNTAGSAFTIAVTALDAFGNTVPGYLGTVHFTSSDPSATLPADYTFQASDGGTHTFVNGVTLVTAGSQSVIVSAAGMSSASGVVTVSPAAVASLSLMAPTAATAGTAVTVTVTALDAYGNVATGYNGTVHFTSTDGLATLPGDYAFTATDQGTHTFTGGVTLDTAASQTVTATDTASSSLTASATLTVSAAAATHLRVSAPAGSTAGTSFDLTVVALDSFNNVATGYAGTIALASSDNSATLPGNYTFTASDGGSHTFAGGVTLDRAGTQTVTATETASSSISGTATVLVSPAATSSLRISAPAGATAGAAFNLTVTAFDPFGNVTPGYTGTVHFTSSDSQAALPGDYTFTAGDAGIHNFNATLKTAGTQSLTAADTTTGTINGTASVAVSSASASHLSVTGSATATAGAAFTVTVTALDPFGNTATGYTGTVHFTSSDGQAVLPSDYTFTAADAGVHTFNVTLKTAGTQSLTVTDRGTPALTGTQAGITVTAAAAATFVVTGFPSSTTAGAAHTFTVKARDAFGNVATGYTGTIHITSSDGQAGLPANYTFTAADAGVHTFTATLKTAGNQSLTVTDTGTASVTGSESGINVVASGATHFSITAPASVTSGVAFSIIVTARDAYGNVATGYLGKVHFTSSDHKAILPADYAFLSSDGGVHTFTVILKTQGTQSITATDTANSSIQGSANVKVSHN